MAKKSIRKTQSNSKNTDKLNKNDRILFAFLATFLSIIGFIIAILSKRQDKYVMFYARQSLIIFIISVILGISGKALEILPIVGTLINVAIGLLVFLMWIVSWLYALTGEEREIPIVSEFAEKIRF